MISRVGFNTEVKKLAPQHFGIFSNFLFLPVIASLASEEYCLHMGYVL